jgi:hypothetical protein
VVRSLLFWAVLGGVVVYLLRSYVRDRPELVEALRSFAPLRWLSDLWTAMRQWLRRAGRSVQKTMPALIRRLRRGRTGGEPSRGRSQGSGTREQIFYHYLSTLDQAGERGFPRQGTETPYEYRRTLEPHLPEGREAMTGLTEAFIEARYSTHEITHEMLDQQRANAEAVRRALHRAEEDDNEEA